MKKKGVLTYYSGGLLSFIGLAAVICGMILILEPNGAGLEMSLDILKNSPFNDFFIPGLILLSINGILSLIGALLTFVRYRYSGIGLIVLGAAMIIWIAAQLCWIGWESWLQTIFIIVGLLEMVLGLFLDAELNENGDSFGGNHAH